MRRLLTWGHFLISETYPAFVTRKFCPPRGLIMRMEHCPVGVMARWFNVVGAVLVAIAILLSAGLAVAADPMDWPNWRGPEQNRISRETGLIDKWDPESGENVLWKNTEAAGICSPIVLNGKVYLQVRYKPDTKEEQEEVICVDANTGKTLWENRWNVYLSDVPAERVGWSPVVGDPETGRIYAQGVNGYFSCIDGETGKTIWSRSLGEEFGMISPYGGRTHPPALFEDLVIINGVMVGWGDTAPPAHRILALDKNTGEPQLVCAHEAAAGRHDLSARRFSRCWMARRRW